ncbi:MAG TPA: tripartite tricarboxylate transporter substrate binding protein [Falsiroseomonas sp.]|jgi:tripartite-type tricarboxylate transporter receptor subunit TctC|nr:tripartite tricarboxylate transporter substrate binding protein [Falsiroseomonas sp.]
MALDGLERPGSALSVPRPPLGRRGVIAAALAACVTPRVATAQSDFPTQSLRLVVPFAPGAGSDISGRVVAEALGQKLGQPVIVENRPGAGSAIGVGQVARARADGYTLLWSASDGLSIAAAVKPALPYKVPEDFAYIARVAGFPFILATSPQLPVRTLQELIDHARANPGRVRYGTAGVGSGPHMATELFARRAGISVEHVPFGGIAPALNAMLAGDVQMAFGAPPAIKPSYDGGLLRVIAVAGEARHPLFPEAPTTAEAGLRGVEMSIWWGLVAPAATPEPALARLRRAANEMNADPDFAARLRRLGFDHMPLAGEAFRSFVVEDLERWRETAAAANIRLD